MRSFSSLLASVLLLTCTASLSAQTPTASTGVVTGTIRDQSRAAIPGAEVSLVDESTLVNRTAISNDEGYYAFGSVLPGNYRIEVVMPGFNRATVRGLIVEITKAYSVDVVLEVGAVTQSIDVVASLGAELQKADATVGNTLTGESIMRLPNLTRDLHAIQFFQPLAVPYQGADEGRSGAGSFAGARTDQNTYSLDGADITDTVVGNSFGAPLPSAAIPLPNESVQEFRVGTTNPNATFGRSSGAQLAVVTKRGTNAYHGSFYWYHQNDDLNANTWTRNRSGIERPELKDNRFGLSVGGPVVGDKTFFFFNYEGRRFPASTDASRIVPTDELRAGILRFRDADGNVNAFSLLDFDPRSIGLNPLVKDLWARLPAGNNPGLGDGLNTTGFTASPKTSIDSNDWVGRLDHDFNDRLRFNGSFRYSSKEELRGSQVDIGGILEGNTPGVAAAVEDWPREPRLAVGNLTAEFSPAFSSDFRVAWVRDFLGFFRASPFPQVPGANMAFNVSSSLIDEPLDVVTGRARSQSVATSNWQFINNSSWSRGNHSIQFGGSYRHLFIFHPRNDKVVGSVSSLVAELDDANFLSIPSSARPPTCGSGVTAGCLQGGDVTRWNRLYAGMLGLIDNTSVMIVRDGQLQPLPIGTEQEMEATSDYYEIYVNDTWRATPSLVLNLGLTYQVQVPPTEVEDRFTFLTNNETGEFFDSVEYLEQVRTEAMAGRIFNPELSYTPLASSSRSRVTTTDWGNLGPRIAAAWSPSYSDGFLGALFGERKTVLRGGYSKVFDRINTVQSVLIPALGVAFAQTINLNRPTCDASASPGPGCQPGNASHPISSHRIGVDGPAPIPTIPPATAPVVPPIPFSELISFQGDFDLKVGRTHSLNFTLQRELPRNFLFEAGWVARFSRELTQNRNLNATPFFFVDPPSSQSFADAFDRLAAELRAGVAPGAVSVQPFFENQLGAGWTQILAGQSASDFIDGNVSSVWLNINVARQFGLGLEPYSNIQVLENWVRGDGGRAYYSGVFFTLRKRFSEGLSLDANYTISQALDQLGRPQNTVTAFSSPFFPDIDYGPADFDRRHIFNTLWNYDLPFGSGRRYSSANGFLNELLGGWHFAGIFSANTGAPMGVCQSNSAFGGGQIFTGCTAAIAVGDVDNTSSVNSGVAGSGGVGTSGDPAGGGTGLNMFSNPEAIFDSFRKVNISSDRRAGRGIIRGLARWSVDLSFGKRTTLSEDVRLLFSLDLFNAFNQVQFDNGDLDLKNPAAFGVLTSQGNEPRALQFGLRVEF